MSETTGTTATTVTVCVLTFNGERYLDEILDACLAQHTPFAYGVLVVDSGSTDATLDIVARHPEVRLHRIPNREFGHGRTRNLAASLAGADIVVFLTHDATPVGTSWLRDLVTPLLDDSTLAGVHGRQRPRPRCRPACAREVLDAFRTQPPDGFFSNVCSAIRTDVLRRVPFRDVDYAEDRAFAADAAAAGLRVAYVPGAEVLHSHDLALGAYFRRMYDEAAGLRETQGKVDAGLIWLAGAAVRGTVRDWAFVATNRDYTLLTKLRHAAGVPLYNVARRVAIWLGARPLPGRLTGFLSLERHRRRVAVG